MAKKRSPETPKKDESRLIDHIPDHEKQRRSPAPKRRTDFSFFSSSSASISLSNSGYLRHGSSGASITCSDDNKSGQKELPELPPIHCETSMEDRSRPAEEFYEVPSTGVESSAQNTTIDHCSCSQLQSDASLGLESTPEKIEVRESNGVCITPGNVVWAKTPCKMWWPAEIIGETNTALADSKNGGIDGHVFVQFYGNQPSAWVDPVTDVSEFEDRFEERSCNSHEDFQDALKQALKRKEDLNSHAHSHGSRDESSNSTQQDQLSNKCASSISSGTDDNFNKRRKGQRERRPNIRFHEVTFPQKAARKVRRFRIMRHLGLIAPVGSPF